jgi:acetoin utilization protein AcuB
MLVGDWMTQQPLTVPPTTTVLEAMQLLRAQGFRRLPVVLGGVLVGLVTDRDLKEATPRAVQTRSIHELNYQLAKLTLRDVMRTELHTVTPDEPIEQAAARMQEHKVGGLPVVVAGALVGMITVSDLLRGLVNVLGVRDGGRRVSIDLPDAPGALARVAAVAPPSNVVAVVTAGVGEGRTRRLVLRVVGDDADGFADRLRALGVEVRDVR